MRWALVACMLVACGEPEPDARSEPRRPSRAMPAVVEGVHPGPIELPHARMQRAGTSPDQLGAPEPTGMTFDDAPLDLSVVGEEGRGYGQACNAVDTCRSDLRCCERAGMSASCLRPDEC